LGRDHPAPVHFFFLEQYPALFGSVKPRQHVARSGKLLSTFPAGVGRPRCLFALCRVNGFNYSIGNYDEIDERNFLHYRRRRGPEQLLPLCCAQVYVGNYEFDADERELKATFSKFGAVRNIEFKEGRLHLSIIEHGRFVSPVFSRKCCSSASWG